MEFVEESDPVVLAEDFALRDHDSSDSPGIELTVTLTLTQALDEDSEGVRLVTRGGVTLRELESTEEYMKQYILSNGTSYSQYEEVFARFLCKYGLVWGLITPTSCLAGAANFDLLQL